MAVMRCFLCLVLLVLAQTLAACDRGGANGGATGGATAPTEMENDKPLIVASIFPLASLTRELAGDDFQIVTLLPSDASPHGFDLKPAQRAGAAKARLLVMVGMGLDDWAVRAVTQDVTVLHFATALQEEGEAHEEPEVHAGHEAKEAKEAQDAHAGHAHDHTGPNPHLWLDPVLTRDFVAELATALAKLRPDRTEAIAQRAKTLDEKLAVLDGAYREQLAVVPVKTLVTFHNAFDRPAARYGLQVVAHLTPIELSPGAEITPRRLQAAIDQVAALHLRVLYAEPQFPKTALDAIARATGADILILDPLGSPNRPGYETYFAMMQSNLATLVKGQTPAQ